MLVCVFLSAFARETAGAARTRSSLRPLLRVALRPLLRVALRPLSREGGIFQQNSGVTCREIAKLCFLHLAPLAGRGRRASLDARRVRRPLREAGFVETPPHPLARARDLSPQAGRGKKALLFEM